MHLSAKTAMMVRNHILSIFQLPHRHYSEAEMCEFCDFKSGLRLKFNVSVHPKPYKISSYSQTPTLKGGCKLTAGLCTMASVRFSMYSSCS
jgi:hypothetical protein